VQVGYPRRLTLTMLLPFGLYKRFVFVHFNAFVNEPIIIVLPPNL